MALWKTRFVVRRGNAWFFRLKRSCGGAKREIVPVPVLFLMGEEFVRFWILVVEKEGVLCCTCLVGARRWLECYG